jgi:hypothetical protein
VIAGDASAPEFKRIEVVFPQSKTVDEKSDDNKR